MVVVPIPQLVTPNRSRDVAGTLEGVVHTVVADHHAGRAGGVGQRDRAAADVINVTASPGGKVSR